jgi:hypothetical protein
MLAVRPKVKPHRVCAWCRRLIHRDGTTHGPEVDPSKAHDRGYSSGICRRCFGRLMEGRQCS